MTPFHRYDDPFEMDHPYGDQPPSILAIPTDPVECLRRYIGLWPDAPEDEYQAARRALDALTTTDAKQPSPTVSGSGSSAGVSE
jgi:hypothetical protein